MRKKNRLLAFASVLVLSGMAMMIKARAHREKKANDTASAFQHPSGSLMNTRQPAQATSLPASAAAPQSSSVQDISLEIEKVQECSRTGDCPLDQTDPRAYDFAIGEKLAALLKEAHLKFKNDPAARPFLKKLALEHFQNENGFVQEAAFEILKDFPFDQDILQAIADGLHDNYNPAIVENCLPEFQKYMGTELEPKVHAILQDLLLGAHFSSLTVTRKIGNFINSQSYGRYASSLSEMKPGSRSYQQLRSALTEFERRKSGADPARN